MRQNFGCSFDIELLDSDGNTIIPDASDVVTVQIKRRGDAAVFNVDSSAPTAAGSSVTKATNAVSDKNNVLRVDASDVNFTPGIYSMMIELLDDSDSQEPKHADYHIVTVEGT